MKRRCLLLVVMLLGFASHAAAAEPISSGEDAKSDADVCAVSPAIERDAVTLWTNAYAERLIVNGAGDKVVAAEVVRDGEPVRVEAPLFVVSCGAVNSAALLLRSARPIFAWTRRMGNVPSVTHITSTSSGSSSPVIETWLLSHIPMSSNVRLSSR